MSRRNSQNWSVSDDVTAARLQDINEDLDDIYAEGSDRMRVVRGVSGTALKYDVGAGGYRVGLVGGFYAGSTDNTVTNNSTTYIEIDDTGTLQQNTTAFSSDAAPLAVIVSSGGIITSITQHKPDAFGGDLGGNFPDVNVETLSGNKTLANADPSFQFLTPNGSNRDVTLGTTTVLEGRPFYIKNNSATGGNLVVKQSSTILVTLYPGQSCLATYDGTDWRITLEVVDSRYGDGRDGALSVTSGTTTLDAAGAKILIKQYTSISITGGTLTMSNPHNEGTILVMLSQGNVTVTGSTIDLSGMGAIGGTGVTVARSGDSTAGVAGNAGTTNWNSKGGTRAGGGGNFSAGTFGAADGSGGGGAASMTTAGTASTADGSAGAASAGAALTAFEAALAENAIAIEPGSGGGSGGVAVHGIGGTVTATSQNAGRGGGGLYIACGGAWNFTGTINLSGTSSSNSTCPGTGSGGGAAGGSAGGSSGCGAVVVRGAVTADSGTRTCNAGSPGTAASYGASTATDGGASAAGTFKTVLAY